MTKIQKETYECHKRQICPLMQRATDSKKFSKASKVLDDVFKTLYLPSDFIKRR